jgi:hypothetical protein
MRAAVLGVILAAASASPTFAQQFKPLPPYVVDVRGFMTSLGRDAVTATDLGVPAAELPGRGFGGVVGLQVYPVRNPGLTLGLGGELLMGRGRAQPPQDPTNPMPLPPIEQRLTSLTGTVSMNFGARNGWSYLSAGAGPLRFETFNGPHAPAQSPPFQLTLNLGAGARWFSSSHVAFCFDVRAYLTGAMAATATSPGRGKQRLLVLSAGLAIR